MYQVVPGTFKPSISGHPTDSDVITNICETQTPYNTITYPWFPPNPMSGTTITNATYPSPPSLQDNEVNVEQVQNGFIITAKNHVLVAVDMVQLTDVLTKFFNGEYE